MADEEAHRQASQARRQAVQGRVPQARQGPQGQEARAEARGHRPLPRGRRVPGRGDCLVPLLQQCVFKKTKKGDNADVVQAALSCARAFLEAVPESQPDEEEGAATPEPPRALLLFEAAEKKKNKLSGGKLFADLLAHENGEIVVDAAACGHCSRRLALARSIHT